MTFLLIYPYTTVSIKMLKIIAAAVYSFLYVELILVYSQALIRKKNFQSFE